MGSGLCVNISYRTVIVWNLFTVQIPNRDAIVRRSSFLRQAVYNIWRGAILCLQIHRLQASIEAYT